jgi:hypothetical protein
MRNLFLAALVLIATSAKAVPPMPPELARTTWRWVSLTTPEENADDRGARLRPAATRPGAHLGLGARRFRLAGSLTRCDGGIPDPPEGYAGAVVACDSTPKVPFEDRHASMRRPSRVPLPSLTRSLSGRRTDAERT